MLEINIKVNETKNNISEIDILENILYKSITETLKNIPIEYIFYNKIELKKYNISIGYNVFTKKLQFNDDNDYYLKNIRHILLNNDINKVIDYILNCIDSYIIEYYNFIINVKYISDKLENIYL